jgi:hypothetical protein
MGHSKIEAIFLQPFNKAEVVGIDADRPLLDLPPYAIVVVEGRPRIGVLTYLITLSTHSMHPRRQHDTMAS